MHLIWSKYGKWLNTVVIPYSNHILELPAGGKGVLLELRVRA